ncbi:hypothetical protein HHK36_011781 [Tetracentron sinense]|uniref:MADS-box domain-containing protein n=1 Tax=Tetracentron sinense TaxID=13715 RepID=A0A834ZBM7_TETSI|nr:hypothetical protein HHK36_011781 [Tetracentron sinense]
MGKRKIAIEKLENPNKRQVTFSKRRKGLFKKAADACLLCDAEIAVIAFSPAGKPYTFGHTSVDSVIDRYLTRSSGPVSGGNINIEAEQSRLSREIKDLERELKQQRENNKSRYWWEQIDVEKYDSVDKLQSLIDGLEKLRSNIVLRLPSSFANGEGLGSTGGDNWNDNNNDMNPPLLLTNGVSTVDYVDQAVVDDGVDASVIACSAENMDDDWLSEEDWEQLMRDDIELLPAV